MKKLFRNLVVAFALIASIIGVSVAPTAEAGHTVTYDDMYGIYINDNSIYYDRVGHANAQIKYGRLGYEDSFDPILVSVAWGKGYYACRIDSYGNEIGSIPNVVQLALANYFSKRYQ